jgi:hypothetical protein
MCKFNDKCKCDTELSITDCRKPKCELLEKRDEKCCNCRLWSLRFGYDYECNHHKDAKCKKNHRDTHNHSDKHNCNIKIKSVDDLIKNKHESISLICDSQAIIFPSTLFNDHDKLVICPSIYDFESKSIKHSLSVDTGCTIFPQKITGATNIEKDNSFWLLGVNYDCNKYIHNSLIKVCYKACEKKLIFIAQYNILFNDCESNNCAKLVGLCKVSNDEFIVFSSDDDENNHDGDYKQKMVFITIKNHRTCARNIHLKIRDHESFDISTTFNTKDGVVLVPRYPEHHCGKVFMIANEKICKLKKELECQKFCNNVCSNKCSHKYISIDACIIKLCKSSEYDDKQNDFIIYNGIGTITSDDCGRLYGLSTWVYPFIVFKNEVPVPVPPIDFSSQYVITIDTTKFPDGYDRSKAGYYAMPLIGKTIFKSC